MSYDETKFQIFEYVDANNISPFTAWFSMVDDYAAERIVTTIRKVQTGIFSNCKSLGQGLWELKLHYGPGIRIYFGKRGQKLILLWGGTKNQQQKDIVRSRKYWGQYLKTEELITWH